MNHRSELERLAQEVCIGSTMEIDLGVRSGGNVSSHLSVTAVLYDNAWKRAIHVKKKELQALAKRPFWRSQQTRWLAFGAFLGTGVGAAMSVSALNVQVSSFFPTVDDPVPVVAMVQSERHTPVDVVPPPAGVPAEQAPLPKDLAPANTSKSDLDEPKAQPATKPRPEAEKPQSTKEKSAEKPVTETKQVERVAPKKPAEAPASKPTAKAEPTKTASAAVPARPSKVAASPPAPSKPVEAPVVAKEVKPEQKSTATAVASAPLPAVPLPLPPVPPPAGAPAEPAAPAKPAAPPMLVADVSKPVKPEAPAVAPSEGPRNTEPYVVPAAKSLPKSAEAPAPKVAGAASSTPSEPAKAAVDEVKITVVAQTAKGVVISDSITRVPREFRVGSRLPSGEVIKSIDTATGQVTTDRRVLKMAD